MLQKYILAPNRVRKITKQFSWIDGRLVQAGHLKGSPSQVWSLYLFLISVSDAEGLSYYKEESIGAQLSLEISELRRAREILIGKELIAYQPPLYQVLSLPELAPLRGPHISREPPNAAEICSSPRGGEIQRINQVLAQVCQKKC